MNPLVLIPSRYLSTRFPGKPLELINDKSLIQRVYENLLSSEWESVIVTDDDRIEKHIKDFNGQVVRVNDETESGTDRIYLAYKKFFDEQDFDFIINVQGDEPLINADLIKRVLEFHENSNFDIVTLCKRRTDDQKNNSNIVKLVKNEVGKCHYFSRSAIPFGNDEWFQHIGVYSYKVDALTKYIMGLPSKNASTERLEQLKALDNNLSIGALEVNDTLIGVDTPENIKEVEEYLNSKGKK